MSRISQLKETIEINQARIVNCTQFIKEAKDELAALEARERKPRVFCIQLFEGGAITENTFRGTMPPLETITVIEKLPVKITTDLAKRFNRDMTQYIGGYKYSQEEIAEVARFFGLQAEPSND